MESKRGNKKTNRSWADRRPKNFSSFAEETSVSFEVPPVPKDCANPVATLRLLTSLAENDARISHRLRDLDTKDTAFAMLSREKRENAIAMAKVCGVVVEVKAGEAVPVKPVDPSVPGLRIDLSRLPEEQRRMILARHAEKAEVPN